MTQNETVVPTGVVSPTPVVNNIQPQMTVPFPNGAAQMPGQTVSGNPMPNNVGAQGGNINPMTSHPVITQPNLVAAPTGNADPNMNIQVNPINLGNNN